MGSLIRLVFTLAVVAGIGACPVAASAANGDETALLNAVAYGKLPRGSAIMVQAMDNSDANMVLQRDFETILRQQGYRVAKGAKLILSFETRDEVGAWSSTGRRSVIEATGGGGRSGGEKAKIRLNIFDSNRGGVLNKGKSGTSIVSQSHSRLDVSIDDETSGKRLWQAWSTAVHGGADGRQIIRAMIPEVVKKIGSNVKRQTYSVD